jgi:site-specific DNA-adenine methylase
MYYFCNVCKYERATAPASLQCPACGIGMLQYGHPASGFQYTAGIITTRNLDVPIYLPKKLGAYSRPRDFNYFVNTEYRDFILSRTTYVGRFTNILVPDDKRFAWLSPYTGNKHNRTHFTQLLLATVGRAQFQANGGRFPRLIEPFVGSGQIFLHARAWGPSLNYGMHWFHELIAGDLNPYVIAAYGLLIDGGANAADLYDEFATINDAATVDPYDNYVTQLDALGRQRATSAYAQHRRWAARKYLWLVNRCLRGAPLNANGGLTATRNSALNIDAVRAREKRSIAAISGVFGGLHASFACQDFLHTTAHAQPGDVVVMDCPFPKFANTVPKVVPTRPETFDSAVAHTYGTGDDGVDLQSRIVDEAQRLIKQGTTVILCNFANPGLVLAYRKLLGNTISEQDKRHYVYTYRSPSTQSEAYQVTILPGNGVDLSAVPTLLRQAWINVGGDDGYDADNQQFFTRPTEDSDSSTDPSESDEEFDDDIEDPDYDPMNVN